MDYMSKCNDYQGEMLKLVWLLKSEECQKSESWRQLGRKFIVHFRPQIIDCLGYDGVEPAAGRVPLADEDFWCDLLGKLKVEYFFGDISFDYLVQHVYKVFAFQNAPGSVSTEIKMHCSEYSDCISRFLKEIKDIQKSKREI